MFHRLLKKDRNMNTTTLFPPLHAFIGAERAAQRFHAATQLAREGYPPYNVIKTGEDTFRIEVAVAGFTENELSIVVEDDQLTISGTPERDSAEADSDLLHRGIANRAFTRKFVLGEYMKVKGARLEHGLLSVDLNRELPEERRPVTIAIETK